MSVSAEKQSVSVGEHVSVSCNVSGHPQPELYWLNKHNGQTLVRVYGYIHTTAQIHPHAEKPTLSWLNKLLISVLTPASLNVCIYSKSYNMIYSDDDGFGRCMCHFSNV